ncbi:protein Z-dependent protease inhibitor-like [Paramacrobiotus metropolitanus]|uniref:protein Z-dependent protease inhibitor-like n=1 Tax=Paramacrobiotus metropolitanus TaxID=2943436 RepID=UPI0024461CEA|nr:protein Z-dependent protease inhibitor-like [Paramacrobiotus metropolitanus]
MIILNIDRRQFSVMILLPMANSGGTPALEGSLTVEKLLAWRDKSKDSIMRIVLPKFRISCTVNLQPCLTARGLGGVFAPLPVAGVVVERATLKEETVEEEKVLSLHPDEILQHVLLDMDEYGMSTPPFEWPNLEYSMVDSDPDFVANRPFLVIIWDEVANVPLFLGRVTDPTVSSCFVAF